MVTSVTSPVQVSAFMSWSSSARLNHAQVSCSIGSSGETLPRRSRSTKERLYLYTSEASGTGCRLKAQCTTAKQRWVSRHFDEGVLNEVADGTDANPLMMRRRKAMVEHPFGTLKRRMDGGRFLLRGLEKVKAEMALAATAYNLTRAINVPGARRLCQALAT